MESLNFEKNARHQIRLMDYPLRGSKNVYLSFKGIEVEDDKRK